MVLFSGWNTEVGEKMDEVRDEMERERKREIDREEWKMN